MNKKIISLILTLIFAISCFATVSADNNIVNITVSGKQNYNYANEVVKYVNEQRAKNGLSSLTMDKDLLNSAMQRAAEIMVYFSHTRPNGQSCFSAVDWEKTVGENIAYGQRNAKDVMNSWMNSEGHKQNILNSNFKSIGVGCFIDESGTIYWVQIFDGGNPVSVEKVGTQSVSTTIEVSKTLVPDYEYYLKNSSQNNSTNKPTSTKTNVTSKLKKPAFSLSLKRKKMIIKIKKVPKATGYQILFKEKSQKRWKTVNTTAKKVTISGLTKGKKYNVKVRAVKKTNSKTIYSSFSKTKTFKAK